MTEQQSQLKCSPSHGIVTPTETTAATLSASTSVMTPTKTSESNVLATLASANSNGSEKKIEMTTTTTTTTATTATTTETLTSAASSVTTTATTTTTDPASASAALPPTTEQPTESAISATLEQRATSAFALPKEATQYSPLLVGKYYIQDKRAVWTGRWGMTEAAFEENGITSPFEMTSQEDVFISTCMGSYDSMHPAFGDRSLARSMRVENVPASEICPAYFGYEADASVRSAIPFQSKYSGYFQIQATKGKATTVTEKDVEMRFVHDPSLPSHFLVSGSGENRFGLFSLHGSLNKATNELRVFKVYKPKEKEKRSLPRRGRATKAAVAQVSAARLQTKALSATPAAPVHVAVVTPPASMSSVAAPVAIVTPRPSAAAAAATTVAPAAVDYSATTPLPSGRPARKIVKPARQRDENVIEFDRVPHGVKKCHSILKGLMANPKAAPFLAPVDPVALGIPDYFHVIKEPMDLGTIRQNLESGCYLDIDVFADHVRLVFRNAMLYNAAHSQVHIFAVKLLEDFEKRMKSLSAKAAGKDKSGLDRHKLAKSAKHEKKYETGHSTKKIKGGKGAKGNTKRRVSEADQGLIMSLKEDLERLKATLEQLQPSTFKTATPKPSKTSRPAARCVATRVCARVMVLLVERCCLLCLCNELTDW